MDLFHPMIISDYYFAKTAIFAQNTLKPDEFHLFRQIFNMVSENIPKPDLYIYLHTDTQNLLKNIKKRGRDYEQNISAEYLDKIKEGYFSYFRQMSLFPILLVDVNHLDFVENPDHYELLKKVLLKNNYKLGINRMILP